MKKTLITVVRHAETEWNVAMRLQGIQDSALTPKGIRQVELLAETLVNQEYDILISSDLGRAVKTAQIIAKKINLSINKDPSLRERNFGIMEGLTREQISKKYPDVLSSYSKRKETYQVENGESLREFNKRVLSGLANIVSLNEGKNLLIVSHGGVLDCIIRKIFDYPLSASRSFSIYNTSINVFSIAEGKWTLEQWGIVNHLHAMEKLNEFN